MPENTRIKNAGTFEYVAFICCRQVQLDQFTDTVINDEGERCKVVHYALYAGLGQPDELSVNLIGVRPVKIEK